MIEANLGAWGHTAICPGRAAGRRAGRLAAATRHGGLAVLRKASVLNIHVPYVLTHKCTMVPLNRNKMPIL